MRKRITALTMAGVMTAALLSGCSGGNSTSTTTAGGAADTTGAEAAQTTAGGTEAAAAGEKVEITYWDQNADTKRTEIFNKLIADFEAENPNITVKLVPVPADQAKSKYDVAIQSHTAPDCGGVSQYWMSDFLIQDALVPLDDYIAGWDQKDKTLSEFDESIRSMAPDGKMYGLAHMVTVPVVCYNTELMNKSGCEIPEDWDGVFDCVEKMTDKANGVYGFSIRGGAGSSQQFEQMMYQYSGQLDMFDENGNSTANDPAHVELLEKFASIYNVYTPESDITNAVAEMNAAFDSGSAGMIFHNLGSYGQHVQTLGEDGFAGLVRLNAANGTRTIVSNGAMCLSVFKDSKHPAEAFKFVSFLAQHEACSYISEQIGQIPCNKEALEDEWVQKAGPIKEAADALLDSSTTVTTLPINVIGYYDLHQNTLVEGFQNVLLGNMTAQEYLDSWASEMTRLKSEYDQYLQTK